MLKRWFILFILAALAFFLAPYSLPFIFAFITAFLLEGSIHWLEANIRLKRIYAVLITYMTYLFAILTIGYFLFQTIIRQTISLSERTPNFVREIYKTAILPLIDKWKIYSENLPKEVIDSISSTVERTVNSLDHLMQQIIQFTLNLLTAIPGFLIEFLIYIVALFLIGFELPRLKEKMDAHLTESTKQKFYLVGNQLNKAGVGFLKAQIILSFTTFVMAYVGLKLLNVPYTALLSLLIVVVDILPILGTGSVLVPWATVAILQQNQQLGIGLLILFAVITVVRRIIEPKIYSTSLGITPLAALISLYIGFQLLGFIGIIVGPAIVIVYDTLKTAGIIQFKFKI